MPGTSQPSNLPPLPLVYLTRPPQQPSEPGQKPPLVLLLHGVGSNEKDLFSLASYLPPSLRVVSLRAPLEHGPGAYAWFDVTFMPEGFAINAEQLDRSRGIIMECAARAVAAFGADPAQVYLLGFSQGAILSLAVALTQPEQLAGILPLAGRIPPEVQAWAVAPERMAGLPVFLAHGRFDSVIPFFWAEQARDFLRDRGVTLTVNEYPTDHRISPDMLADAMHWLEARLAEPRWQPFASASGPEAGAPHG